MGTTTEARRLPGVGATVATRVCQHCRFALPLGYFYGASKICFVCNGDARDARPWTTEQLAELLAAARHILDLWPRYVDQWTEEELKAWRALLSATGRIPLYERLENYDG